MKYKGYRKHFSLALSSSYLPQTHGIQLDLGTKADVEKQTSVFSLVSFQTS